MAGVNVFGNHITRLLKRITERDDQRAFRDLYDHYFRVVYSAAFAYVRDVALAEEVAEDVFVSLWQNRSRFGEIRNFDNYVFIATRNAALHYIRKRSRMKRVPLDQNPASGIIIDSPESQLLDTELEVFLDGAVERLPERCRHIFKLVRIRGMKYKEVATLLDISVKTVENQVTIALKKLHEDLNRYYSPREVPARLKKIS